jgi:crotonobetainyl-CoA:carnitine CoA-transferase CaiB-like acyl-CoA transferase
MLQTVEHPLAGTLRMLASPVLVDGERPPVRRPPPTLGQHTGEMEGDGWER